MRVQCYGGYKAHERPVAFWLGAQQLAVLEVEDRWYGPDSTWFRVRAADGRHYVLRHREHEDSWSLEALRRSDVAPQGRQESDQ